MGDVKDQLPDVFAVVVPRRVAPSYTDMVDPASAVPVMVGVLSFVEPDSENITGADGAVVSTYQVRIAGVESTLFAASTALTLNV